MLLPAIVAFFVPLGSGVAIITTKDSR